MRKTYKKHTWKPIKWKSVKIIDFDTVYLNKVVNIYDREVAEFCYKSIMNTLSCNLLLFKSKIKDMPNCDLCKVSHDIKHLLWDCINARQIWLKVKE